MFFIPCIKWNKHYYVRTSCCNTLYELDPEMGKAIARGEQVLIRPEHLQRISKVTYGYNYKHAITVGMRQQKILSIAQSAVRNFKSERGREAVSISKGSVTHKDHCLSRHLSILVFLWNVLVDS